jgi:uncharacterized membrane protein YdbT with pleckstrin-like domain
LSASPKDSATVVWTNRPWVLPHALARTIIVFVASAFVLWLETFANAASISILDVPVWTWTVILFLIAWLASLIPLAILNASHRYTLRSDSLEVKTGIASLKSFVLSPAGFSDLEIRQSLIERIVNSGDITIHTQAERVAVMQKVKNPNNVAGQIRNIMGKPTVRIES